MTGRRIRLVDSFEDLVGTPFSGDVNALCWQRRLPGDFREIVDRLRPQPGISTIAEEDLEALELSPDGEIARAVLLADQTLLADHGLSPALDCVVGEPRRSGDGPIPIDVASFHIDTATGPADTYLCTYAGGSTEGLPNEQAIRRIDDPATRARLLRHYGGPDDEAFAAYLSENFFDLHYAPLPGAQPYTFGTGHLWRIAISWPGCPVAPCIHRAPLTLPGMPDRLLLIS